MIKLDKIQKQAFDKSKFNKMEKTILASRLDQAFREFNGEFEFKYEPKKGDLGWHPSGDCLPPVTQLFAEADSKLNPEHAVSHKDMSGLNKTFMVGHYWHQVIQFLLVHNDLVDHHCIEREKTKMWGESDPPLYDEAKGKPLLYPYFRKEDLYYGRYLEQQIRDEAGKVIGIDEKFTEQAKHWVGVKPNSRLESMALARPKPFHYVRGSGDIVPYTTDSWTGLVDIKTMGSMDFNLKRVPDRFALKYLCQINIYMDLFDLDQAMILAVNKDSGHGFQEFTFVRDQRLIDEIYNKWKFVSECIQHDVVPNEEDNEDFKLYIEK